MGGRKGPTWPPEYNVGDFVLVPHSEKFSRPGRIVRVYPAHYDSVGPHWRYTVRYVKPDLSDYKTKFLRNCDCRATSLVEMEPLDALARMGKR